MPSECTQSFAVIHAQLLKPRVERRLGFPEQVVGEAGMTENLPLPDILVIEEKSKGSVFLFRLTRDGTPCGDTWHQSIDDARHQAEFEYGETVGSWQPIPQDVPDPQGFAVAAACAQQNAESR